MKRLLLLWLSIVAILAGCNKNTPEEPQPNSPKEEMANIEKVFNVEGGKVITEQGVEVIVPQGAFKEEAKVILKSPKAHPELPQNAQGIRYISKPFTINIEADSLYAPIDLQIPIEEDVDPKDVVVIAIFDYPESLRALKTDQEKLQECMILRSTEWSKNVIHAKFGAYNRFTQKGIEKKVPTNQAYHICVVELAKEKERIEKSQIGLLQIRTSPISNPIKLSATYDINEQDNVLVLVHGWTSSPSDCWSVFANYIVNQGYIKGDKKQYDKILTFGYDSGRHIDENGKDFAEYIKTKLKGAKVDIVAHSMGGLVSRSAIENHGAADYIRSLITLGTPHLGTHVAWTWGDDIRSLLKGINTDGGNDLAYDSKFIVKLDANPIPSSMNYYYIAGGWPKKLPYGDGVVHLWSALRVYSWDELDKSQYNGRIFIPVSHFSLPDNHEVVDFAMQKLKEFADASEEDGVLKNTVLSDDFNASELDLNKWEKTGYPNSVRVRDGVLEMEQNGVDLGVNLRSKYSFKANDLVKISRRAYIHHANSESYPWMALMFEGGEKFQERLVVYYADYDYENLHGTICIHKKTERLNGRSVRPFYVSENLGACIKDSWFKEEILLSFKEKKLVYKQNDTILKEISLPQLRNQKFYIQLNPYGWWTGHKHYMDDFKLEVK